LKIAEKERDKKIVFAGIGFETTSPATAIALLKAKQLNLRNFMVLSAHKLMPPAMQAVIKEGAKIDGYICPGHVSTITGSGMYDIFPQKYGVATVISGFEPVDILLSILMLMRQVNSGKFQTEIQYTRAVKPEGNTKARNLLKEVFKATESEWRGMGFLPSSGLSLKTEFRTWDAEKQFDFKLPEIKPDSGCICGEILMGLKNPDDCSLFAASCKPDSPAGACMVSSEGTCNAWYTWKRTEKEDNKDSFRRLYRVIDGDGRKVYE
ncbi:MAG: hydrogenase formation protein HypD, partial [Bacteroidales bacterium]|nr:hydrogenase formation protein HypD [Bacteroidales bacterium]